MRASIAELLCRIFRRRAVPISLLRTKPFSSDWKSGTESSPIRYLWQNERQSSRRLRFQSIDRTPSQGILSCVVWSIYIGGASVCDCLVKNYLYDFSVILSANHFVRAFVEDYRSRKVRRVSRRYVTRRRSNLSSPCV